jgi:hypothetical protein
MFRIIRVPQRTSLHTIIDRNRDVAGRGVLTEEKLDEIGARLEYCPQKSPQTFYSGNQDSTYVLLLERNTNLFM